MVHKEKKKRTMNNGRFACPGQGIELLFLDRRKGRRLTGQFYVEPGHGHPHAANGKLDDRGIAMGWMAVTDREEKHPIVVYRGLVCRASLTKSRKFLVRN
jgi:hypothetical protein